MAINSFLNCDTSCDATVTLPIIPALQLCTAYPRRYSQIMGIVLQPIAGNVPFDCSAADCEAGTPPMVVTDEVDNTDLTGTKSKYIAGEGGIAVPDKVTDEYPGRQTRNSFRTFTLVLNVYNLECEMYELLRALQCGNTAFKLWYYSLGGWLYGCDDGISISSIDVDFPHSEGRDDKELATITITWDADGDAARVPAPPQLIDQTAEAAANA